MSSSCTSDPVSYQPWDWERPDVSVRINKKIFHLHRRVLIQRSGYFATTLTDLAKRGQFELTLNLISESVFDFVCRWMYNSSALFELENICEVIEAATVLEINDLLRLCHQFLDDAMTVGDPVLVLRQASADDSATVSERALRHLRNNFGEMVIAGLHLQLSADELSAVLGSDQLNVNREIDVLEAVLDWIRHDWARRSVQAEVLLGCVRFHCLEIGEILSLFIQPKNHFLFEFPSAIACLLHRLLYIRTRASGDPCVGFKLTSSPDFRDRGDSFPVQESWALQVAEQRGADKKPDDSAGVDTFDPLHLQKHADKFRQFVQAHFQRKTHPLTVPHKVVPMSSELTATPVRVDLLKSKVELTELTPRPTEETEVHQKAATVPLESAVSSPDIGVDTFDPLQLHKRADNFRQFVRKHFTRESNPPEVDTVSMEMTTVPAKEVTVFPEASKIALESPGASLEVDVDIFDPLQLHKGADRFRQFLKTHFPRNLISPAVTTNPPLGATASPEVITVPLELDIVPKEVVNVEGPSKTNDELPEGGAGTFDPLSLHKYANMFRHFVREHSPKEVTIAQEIAQSQAIVPPEVGATSQSNEDAVHPEVAAADRGTMSMPRKVIEKISLTDVQASPAPPSLPPISDDVTNAAATKIQSWFRGQRARHALQHRHGAAATIQAAVRGFTARKQFTKQRAAAVRLQRAYRRYRTLLRSLAARAIQAWFRGNMTRRWLGTEEAAAVIIQRAWRRHRQNKHLTRAVSVVVSAMRVNVIRKAFLRRRAMATTIQAHIRGFQTRRALHQINVSATRIQRAWRSAKTRRSFKTIRQAALIIQSHFRGARARFDLALRQIAVVVLQRRWRSIVRRRRAAANLIQASVRGFLARKWFLAIRRASNVIKIWFRRERNRKRQGSAAIILQKHFRGSAAREFLAKRTNAATILQAAYRGTSMRRSMALVVAAVLCIQSWWRGYLARKNIKIKRNAASTIQRAFRYHQAKRWLSKRMGAALVLQSAFRRIRAQTWARIRLRAIVRIQRWMRSVLTRRKLRELIVRREAATLIQATVGGNKVRERVLSQGRAATTLQRFYRGHHARGRADNRIASIVLIQSHVRAWLAKTEFLAKRSAAVRIQAWWRELVVRQSYLSHGQAAVTLQRAARHFLWIRKAARWRHSTIDGHNYGDHLEANRTASPERRYLLRHRSAVALQRWWRSSIRKRRGLLERVAAAIVIQKQFRGLLDRRIARRRRWAVAMLQWHVRRFLERRQQYERTAAATKIQAVVRGYLTRRDLFVIAGCAVVVQRALRRWLLQRQRRQAAGVIQRFFRRTRNQREFTEKRNAAATIIQKNFRRMIERNRYHAIVGAIIRLQYLFRKLKRRQHHLSVQWAANVLQKGVREGVHEEPSTYPPPTVISDKMIDAIQQESKGFKEKHSTSVIPVVIPENNIASMHQEVKGFQENPVPSLRPHIMPDNNLASIQQRERSFQERSSEPVRATDVTGKTIVDNQPGVRGFQENHSTVSRQTIMPENRIDGIQQWTRGFMTTPLFLAKSTTWPENKVVAIQQRARETPSMSSRPTAMNENITNVYQQGVDGIEETSSISTEPTVMQENKTQQWMAIEQGVRSTQGIPLNYVEPIIVQEKVGNDIQQSLIEIQNGPVILKKVPEETQNGAISSQERRPFMDSVTAVVTIQSWYRGCKKRIDLKHTVPKVIQILGGPAVTIIVGGVNPLKENESKTGKGSLYFLSRHWNTSRRILRLDEKKQSWDLIGYIPEPVKQAAYAIHDSKVCVIGGWHLQQERTVVSLQMLKPLRRSWSDGPTLLQPRRYHAACSVGQLLVVLGGLDDDNNLLDSVELYSSSWGRWRRSRSSLPDARAAMSACTHHNRIWICGGIRRSPELPGQLVAIDDIHYYDPAEDRIFPVKCQLRAPRAFAALTHLDDALYLLGGSDGQKGTLVIEAFEVNGTSTTVVGHLRNARKNLAASRYGDAIIVLGGRGEDDTDAPTSVETCIRHQEVLHLPALPRPLVHFGCLVLPATFI